MESWTNHIKAISGKIAKNIGIIKKIAHLLPNEILINLYYTYLTLPNLSTEKSSKSNYY